VNAGERKICKSRCSLLVEIVRDEGHASKKEERSEEFHGSSIKHSALSSQHSVTKIEVKAGFEISLVSVL
jgi:hypothetical protein